MMMRRLLRRLLYGGSSRFRDYEGQVLSYFVQHLPPPARGVVELQLGAVDTIQRFSEDKLVVVHLRSTHLPLLANRTPELRVARVKAGDGTRKPLQCAVVFHEGKLSSLEFNRAPRSLASPIQCELVEFLADVTGDGRDADETESKPASTAGLLSRLQAAIPLTQVLPPAPAGERDRFLRSVPRVPADVAALLEASNGFVSGRWRFLGTAARTIVLPEVTYVVLAEREDSQAALCLRDETHAIVYYDEINDEETVAGPGFVEAFITTVQTKP